MASVKSSNGGNEQSIQLKKIIGMNSIGGDKRGNSSIKGPES